MPVGLLEVFPDPVRSSGVHDRVFACTRDVSGLGRASSTASGAWRSTRVESRRQASASSFPRRSCLSHPICVVITSGLSHGFARKPECGCITASHAFVRSPKDAFRHWRITLQLTQLRGETQHSHAVGTGACGVKHPQAHNR